MRFRGILLVTLLTMIEVDANDPAFADPTKFIGPVHEKAGAERLATEMGWEIRTDGDKWRRVVASPQPRRIFQIRPINWLVEKQTVVICAGGGGIPTARGTDGNLAGIEAVSYKDLASELLARDTDADLFISATDAACVYLDWGSGNQRGIRSATPDAMDQFDFAAGSMGPKVAAACQFARRTCKVAAIGALADLKDIVAGAKGTTIRVDAGEMVFH